MGSVGLSTKMSPKRRSRVDGRLSGSLKMSCEDKLITQNWWPSRGAKRILLRQWPFSL